MLIRNFVAAALISAPVLLSAGSVAAFDWTGFYVGVHGGYGWGTDDVRTTLQDSAGDPLAPVANNSFDADGFVGGIQAGANYQIDQFVLGVEGKYSAGNVGGEFNFDETRPEAIAGGDLEGLASISGKAGVALDNTLVYARGGLALAWNNGFANNVFDAAPAVDVATGSDTLNGYVLGVGVEHAVTEQMTIGLDYSHYGFARGDFNMTSDAYPDGVVLRTEPELNLGIVSASLNLHF